MISLYECLIVNACWLGLWIYSFQVFLSFLNKICGHIANVVIALDNQAMQFFNQVFESIFPLSKISLNNLK